MKALTASQLINLKVKHETGNLTEDDIPKLFSYIDLLEYALDETDGIDVCDPEGWRYRIGIKT